MPIVQISVWKGITLENKKKVVEGVTEVLRVWEFPRKQ